MFSISLYNLAFALPKMDWEDSGSFIPKVIKFSLLCSDGCACGRFGFAEAKGAWRGAAKPICLGGGPRLA